MLNFKILIFSIAISYLLFINIGISYAQINIIPNPFLETPSSPSVSNFTSSLPSEEENITGPYHANNNVNNSENLGSYHLDNDTLENIKTADSTTSFSKTFENLQKSIVMITKFNNSTEYLQNNISLEDSQPFWSGFIYDGDGNIITSYHAVSGALENQIHLYNGSIYPAKVIGTDPISDIAVLRPTNISLGDLDPINFANSSEARVAQKIATVGSPNGITNLITEGIVSGTNKIYHLVQEFPLTNAIITNMPYNVFGYGGGPILNTNGQIIGMNTGNNTYPFNIAVSSNMLKKIVPSLITNGSYEYPSAGFIFYSPISPSIAKAMGLNSTDGVLVADIAPNGPAYKGGLKGGNIPFEENGRSIMIGGDFITKLDNQSIRNTNDLMNYMQGQKNVGDEVKLTIIRDGQIFSNFSLTLDALGNIK